MRAGLGAAGSSGNCDPYFFAPVRLRNLIGIELGQNSQQTGADRTRPIGSFSHIMM